MDSSSGSGRFLARILVLIKILILLYLFLVSIRLLGKSINLLGGQSGRDLLELYTNNRFIGLFAGVLATSLVQSSSTVTSIVVGFVGAGTIPLANAIPIVIGANIGTTITNTIVSLGHVRRRVEFKKALAAGTVHDFFNILSTLVILPIELIFHPLEKLSYLITDLLPKTTFSMGKGPLHALLNPPVKALVDFVEGSDAQGILRSFLLIFALALLFSSLYFMVRILGMILGMVITALVQSSSVTTSLLVPMAGAGILTLHQVYPFTLGANMGTTITALLAAMATPGIEGLQIAICHCFFNILGISIFFPLQRIPIGMARRFALLAARKRRYAFLMIGGIFFLLPLFMIMISELLF
ncbi:MAG: Na/Pi symporter [Planctomycetota bacterium]|jgi:sodium-dependent phosphate cotransporter